jgi:dolichol-phosphate mannosyltransferase
MSRVSIVVPVYQSAASLPELMERLRRLADKESADQFEFIFVDDGSTDGSLGVLEDLAREDGRVLVVKLSRNFGSNPALMAGLAHARGDVVAAIASDLQDPPELIGEMLARWRDGHKVVIAARSSRDDPAFTRLMSSFFYVLFRRFALKTMPRQGFDFFLVDRHVRDLLTGIQENNVFLMGLILWLGFSPEVVYYHRREREKRFGRSTWTLFRKLKFFADAFVAFSYVPVRAASLLGIGLSFCGFAYSTFLVFARLFYGHQVEGWTSLMVVLLVVSGAQLIMIGILGEYVWRNLDETRHRPRFIVDRTFTTAAAREELRSVGGGDTGLPSYLREATGESPAGILPSHPDIARFATHGVAIDPVHPGRLSALHEDGGR